MKPTSYYTRACIEAWLNCENLLINMQQKEESFANKTVRVIDECAHVCLGTFQTLQEDSLNVNKAALLCYGICEECAEICDKYDDVTFKKCAEACRHCSTVIAQLAISAA